MTNEKHIKKQNNAVENEARKRVRELRLFAARNLIRICGGDMKAGVKALLQAYGIEYGDNDAI